VPPEDPLLQFSVLYALWLTVCEAFNGDVARERAAQILALAEKQGGKVPLMLGHRAMGVTLLLTGNFAEAVVHEDQIVALYDPVEHRSLATWFLQDPRVGALMYRSMMMTCLTQLISGNYAIAKAQSDELIALAEEKGSAYWKNLGMLRRASLLALTGKASDAVGIFASVIPAMRLTGTPIFFRYRYPFWQGPMGSLASSMTPGATLA
jgi:predicted ATPase